MNNQIQIGDKVRIILKPDADLFKTMWWPKGETTGTVQKIFKNGKIAVAVDQLYAAGDDNKRTLHFSKETTLEVI